MVDVVVVLSNCFLSAEDDTEADADCWTDEDENEAETDELLDMVWLLVSPAGIDATKPAKKQQTKATIAIRLLLLDDVILVF